MLSPALLVLQALPIAPSEPGARFVYAQPLSTEREAWWCTGVRTAGSPTS